MGIGREAIKHFCRECGCQDNEMLRSASSKRKCGNCGAVGAWRRRIPVKFLPSQ